MYLYTDRTRLSCLRGIQRAPHSAHRHAGTVVAAEDGEHKRISERHGRQLLAEEAGVRQLRTRKLLRWHLPNVS